MEGLVLAAQLLLALTILVGLHEFGHFIFARIFKIRVNKFYIFFDFLFPLPNVLNFSLWKKKVGDTEYGLGWFPLGGYVDIAGMVDETKDASQLASEPQPWEFRSKPAWQRLFVMLGGIIVNVILGMMIFSGVKYVWGETDYSREEINRAGIYAFPLAQSIGLQTGDKIIKINGQDFKKFSEVYAAVANENTTYTVLRDSAEVEVIVPNEFIDGVASKKAFIAPLFPFKVAKVQPASPAEKAGLREGDQITALNGTPIKYFQDLQEEIKKNAGKKVKLELIRENTAVTINPVVGIDSTIGFNPGSLLKETRKEFGLGESILKGSMEALNVIPQQINGFARIFKGHISPRNALSSPIGIAQMFSPTWDWEVFWRLTGLISMALAFMNALPIPALDGGHVVLIVFEMITGRQPSEKFVERTQQIGTFILLGLMIFVFGNDILKFFQ